MALTAKALARLNWTKGVTNDLGSGSLKGETEALIEFPAGTSSGQVSKVFSDQRTIAAASSDLLDLAGGVVDPVTGVAQTFAVVKAIMIEAAAANTPDVRVGGATSAGFTGPFASITDIILVPPGGVYLAVHPGAGWTVTATSADILKIANAATGASLVYDITLLG